MLNVDLAPSLIEMAGLEVPATMQGRSWRGVLAGAEGRDAVLYEYFREKGNVPTTLAVRTRTWKLITYPENPDFTEELDDLAGDPHELRNLRHDPAHRADVERLRRALERVKAETGYVVPTAEK